MTAPRSAPARPVEGAVASFTDDGAYDLDDVYAEIAAACPEATLIRHLAVALMSSGP